MSKQVFQATSASRWIRFKWSIRVLLAFALFLVTVFIIALLFEESPSIGKLESKNEVYQRLLKPETAITFKNQSNLDYSKARKYFQKVNKVAACGSRHYIHQTALDSTSQVRSAFYVSWDLQSYFSLRDNITRLNMVFPEWFFVQDNADTLSLNIDDRGYKILSNCDAKVLPMISNFFNKKWNGGNVRRIISSPARKKVFINNVLDVLARYHLEGINIDFEEIDLKSDETLIAFQKELYKALHEKGYLVTQDVSIQNADYKLSDLQQFNDYIVLMTYDEHFATSAPGPVAEQKWIEAALDNIGDDIPKDKIILGMAAYGYDWPKGFVANDVTFEEAITIAKEFSGKIDYDNDSYNLHYTYNDDNNHPHDVWFTDAATNFNCIRTSEDFGLAGVALWRLGAEDRRLWSFYDKDLSVTALHTTPLDTDMFNTVKTTTNIDYIGEGEVLDILTTPARGRINVELDSTDLLISEENYISLPTGYVIKKYGKGNREIVLSFDDGPDPRYTPKILDILKENQVPASFFVVGRNAEENIPLLKRIYKEGHEIGNHSFSHPNFADVSPERVRLELRATRRIIETVTGRSTILFRAPYNADAEPETIEEILPVEQSRKENYINIGESVDPNDWEHDITADKIMQRIKKQEHLGSIILLHDAGGDRSETVKALPEIIKYFRDKGYKFITISQLLGKSKDELMPPVQNNQDRMVIWLNYFTLAGFYWLQEVIFSMFLVAILLSLGRIVFLGVLAYISHWKRTRQPVLPRTDFPPVSIIIPAFNEEKNAVKSVRNLLLCDYPAFEIIFVDDGSTDNTYEKVSEAFKDHPKVRVVTKPNGGKATALNYGIEISRPEFVVCIDADTLLKPDAVRLLMDYFTDEQTGAVAGNVKVGNEVNLITKWQSIEYVTSQNFDRKAFDLMNAITVVPGAIGAFRKSAIEKAGGFTRDTLAEDCDLTVRMLKAGYRVRNCPSAIAVTEAPETLRQFLTQRFRWSFGVFQTFWKHREACFNPKYKGLGLVALPNIFIFQILIPLFAPLADLIMIYTIITGSASKVLIYYLLFMVVDMGVSLLSFTFEKEKLSKLLWLIPQRLVYRQLMYYILIKAIRRALKGELQGWGILHRTGNVQEIGV